MTALAPAPVRRSTLMQRMILDAFSKMTRGSLRIELPDGTVRQIGTPGGEGGEVEASIRVIDPTFFRRCVLSGDIGFGESYVEGEWETDSVERVIAWAILNVEHSPTQSGSRSRRIAVNLLHHYNRLLHRLRPNNVRTAKRNIAEHYDLGNDFYRLWLDPSMTYSSARFSSPDQSLESAQAEKYEALCRKLRLTKNDHVLEIGGGWGGFASHAVRTRGCRVTAVTISVAQFEYARDRFRREGIADRAHIELKDYRHITGRFDKIVSIEMMEALGARYLKTFCAKVSEVLKPDGLAALQYITVPDSRYEELKRGTDWIQKHIFPGSLLLSVNQVCQAFLHTGNLSLFEQEDIGLDYARTLRTWYDNFNGCLPQVRALGFDDRFIRKWNYYLQYCEAAFARRNISVVQAVFSPPNNMRLANSL